MHYSGTPPVNSGKASDGERSPLPLPFREHTAKREPDWTGRLPGMLSSFPRLPCSIPFIAFHRGAKRTLRWIETSSQKVFYSSSPLSVNMRFFCDLYSKLIKGSLCIKEINNAMRLYFLTCFECFGLVISYFLVSKSLDLNITVSN